MEQESGWREYLPFFPFLFYVIFFFSLLSGILGYTPTAEGPEKDAPDDLDSGKAYMHTLFPGCVGSSDIGEWS